MSYLKDREIWLPKTPTGNPPAGYYWKFIKDGGVVVRDSDGVDKKMVDTSAIVNDLTTGGVAVPLSAEQGKNLQDTTVKLTGNQSIAGQKTFEDTLFSHGGLRLREGDYARIQRDGFLSLGVGASITVNGGFGAHLYISNTGGNGAILSVLYPFGMIAEHIAPSGWLTVTDSGTALRVYKSANSQNVTIKNSSSSLQNLYILSIGGY